MAERHRELYRGDDANIFVYDRLGYQNQTLCFGLDIL